MMLDQTQINFYKEHGYLHIPQVFSCEILDAMDKDLNYLIDTWATPESGWTGPWRKIYMDEATEKKAKLIALHDLHLYADSWCQAVTQSNLIDAMADLLGPNVEFEHTTLHAKPPETGHPFPMHQDWAFYQHQDDRYIDVLIHLDDTDDKNGCIRFLDGSHKLGALEHITKTVDGPCTPQLPTNEYSLKNTIPVPAKKGDVVCFNLFTIHGSYINTTNKTRRLVRVGYRDPENIQLSGRTLGRPGLMVRGKRKRINGQNQLSEIQLTGHSNLIK